MDNPGLKITDAMLEVASQIADIDEAVAGVQNQVGIDEGDVASMALEHIRDEWPGASPNERLVWLNGWRDSEIIDGDPAGRSLEDIHAAASGPHMDQDEYIKDPGRCPVCRSENISGGSVEIDGNTAVQNVGCDDCDAEWADTYHLSGYTLTEPGQ